MDILLFVLLLIGAPFAVALVTVRALDRAELAVAVGVVLWLTLTVLSFRRLCPDDASECYPELGALAALVGLLGWLGGVAAGRLWRSRREQLRSR